mgnify:CR=1 FL=1
MKSTILFGGSFNPGHRGHAALCCYLTREAWVDSIWLLPTYIHPFGKPLVSFEHRVEMCHRLLGDHGLEARCQVSEVEKELGGVSRTYDTVSYLMNQQPGKSFSWVIGADVLAELPRWYRAEELIKKISFTVVRRKGTPCPPCDFRVLHEEMPDISSSEIRNLLETGGNVEAFLSPGVEDYVRHLSLYR